MSNSIPLKSTVSENDPFICFSAGFRESLDKMAKNIADKKAAEKTAKEIEEKKNAENSILVTIRIASHTEEDKKLLEIIDSLEGEFVWKQESEK